MVKEPIDLAGTLTSNSSGTGEILSGPSWIEYTPDGGETKTYGTWGNNPTGEGNGLFENLELGRVSDANRSTHINDEQEKKLFDKIQEYKDFVHGKGRSLINSDKQNA